MSLVFIINDIHRNSSNDIKYIKQNGVKSAEIPPHFYSFRHIFICLKNLFMSLFLYISYLLSANWLLQIYKIKRAKSIASLKLGCLIKI